MSTYSINEDREIFRRGEKIATATEEGELSYESEDFRRYRLPISKVLIRAGLTEKKPEPVEAKEVKEEAEPGEENTEIPPMPPKDGQFGDKTPALVEWYRQYQPEEFKRRYGVVGRGMVNEYGEDGEIIGTKEADIATRKTCCTAVTKS